MSIILIWNIFYLLVTFKVCLELYKIIQDFGGREDFVTKFKGRGFFFYTSTTTFYQYGYDNLLSSYIISVSQKIKKRKRVLLCLV